MSLADVFAEHPGLSRRTPMMDGIRAAAGVLVPKVEQPPLPAPPVNFKRLSLYPKQAAIVDDPHRFTICEATTKAGKTMSHIEWILDVAARANEGEWWWVATVSDVADIAFRRSQQRLRGFLDTGGKILQVADPLPFHPQQTRKFIKLGGATVWFKSADQPDSLFGEDVRGAVCDEITRWKETAWHALYTTLSATQGCAKLIGNVKGRKNFAYKLARRAEAGEPGWGYHKLTAADAVAGGVVDQETVDQAERDLPPMVFRELYCAEASEDGGNPFGIDAIRACVTHESTDAPAVWGWDLAKSVDWTWGVALDANGAMCASRRWQKPWLKTTEDILALTANVPALVDSSGVGDPMLEMLQKGRRNFEGFKFSAPSKQRLMEGLAVAIQRQEVAISDPVLVAELEEFEFEFTRTGVRYSAPEGLHDDGVMALALAVEHRRHARRVGDYGLTV
jgi:hypothetical protein